MRRAIRLLKWIFENKSPFINLASLFLQNNSLFQMQLDFHTFNGARNFHGARMWYDELPRDVKDRIQDTGFEDFILALPDA